MARILSSVRGHQQIIGRLLDAHKQQRLPSTFLFVGPEGVGRRLVAWGLAQALACEKLMIGCGECGSCLRIAAGESEAYLSIQPEKNVIKIDQSRRVLDFLSLKSISKARSVVIDEAHLLNPAAANTLLKILEEPPAHTHFFLIAPSIRHLLATLRSRSQVVRFSSLSLEDLKAKSPAPDWVLRSALGSFSRLESFQDSFEKENRLLAWQILKQWQENQAPFLDPKAREWIRDRQVLLSLTRYWLMAFRDASLVQLGEKERLFSLDQMLTLQTLAELPLETLNDLMKKALELEHGLLSQFDPQLCFEQFWILSRRKVDASLYHAH